MPTEITAHSGQIIADRYRLEEPLGHGAMGKIWRAEHLGLSSKVALKFLEQTVADSAEAFNRFALEAQAAAAVRCAHVVQILDCGVDGSVPYISMELLLGESLDKRLRARGALSAAELDKLMREVAVAVDNAHALGVIHRDLKPANIFIAREREREITKVLDFGIAKLTAPDFDRDSAALTSSGILLGTPHYMSPEQARGSRELDHRTDLWSLGIVAYECLTGELPFQGGSMGDIFVQICKEEPRLPSEVVDVPPGFDDWFRKATSKSPAARFGSALEMAESLSRILEEAPVPTVAVRRRSRRSDIDSETLRSDPSAYADVPRSSSPVACTPSLKAPRSRQRWLLAAACAALVGTAAVIAVWPSRAVRSPHRVESGAASISAAAPASPSVSERRATSASEPEAAVHPPPHAPAPPTAQSSDEHPTLPRAPRSAIPVAPETPRAQGPAPSPAHTSSIRRVESPKPRASRPEQPVAPELEPPPSTSSDRDADDLDPFAERR